MNVIEIPHRCDLPDPSRYGVGVTVECGEPRFAGGVWGPCRSRYIRSNRFWTRTPYWANYDYGW